MVAATTTVVECVGVVGVLMEAVLVVKAAADFLKMAAEVVTFLEDVEVTLIREDGVNLKLLEPSHACHF